ncbi:MAG: hypothetical protein JJU27_13980 [Gammaproteobacteria bacterium]|nr:hypothetical protein [Gammaproteobacteria bacterium]
MTRCPKCGHDLDAVEADAQLEAITAQLADHARELGMRLAVGGFLGVGDAATLLGRHRRTIERWLELGTAGGGPDLLSRRVGGRVEISIESLAAQFADHARA